ncbi:MAG: hypothetical protein LBS60_15395 [Deltaproteobacteria bacterium]|jgi:hypothetical protein|nr:hypothetical protein [Deltaproteobacteria bacterium]
MNITFSKEDFINIFSTLLNISTDASTILYDFCDNLLDDNNKKIKITSDLLLNWKEYSYSEFFNKNKQLSNKNLYIHCESVVMESPLCPFKAYIINIPSINNFLIKNFYEMKSYIKKHNAKKNKLTEKPFLTLVK